MGLALAINRFQCRNGNFCEHRASPRLPTSWNRTNDRNDSCSVSGCKLKTMLVTGRQHGRGLQRQSHAINLAFGSELKRKNLLEAPRGLAARAIAEHCWTWTEGESDETETSNNNCRDDFALRNLTCVSTGDENFNSRFSAFQAGFVLTMNRLFTSTWWSDNRKWNFSFTWD